jgi:hypothetical protein
VFVGKATSYRSKNAALGVDVTAWLARLDQNEELWFAGLLDSDAPCWVVVVDGHLLRVHFIDDDNFRDRLREVIDRLPRA